MSYAAGGHTTEATPGSLPDGSDPPRPWSLAGTPPARLAARLTGAAAGVGVVGGMATACLAVLFAASDVLPAARLLAIGLPLVLVALIGWRWAQVTGHAGPAPSNRWIAAVAAAGVVLTAVAQGWSEIGGLDDDITHNAGVALAVVLYGAAAGLMPAVAAIVVTVPTLLLLRASRMPITLPAVQVVLTVLAMAVTAVFALWVTGEMDTRILTGTAAAIAGTGATLTARWALVDRQA